MWILDTKWSDLWAKQWHVWWRLVLSSSGSLNRSSKNSSGLSPCSVLIVTWAHHLLHVKSVYYLPFPYKTTFASQGWWSLLDWVKLMYNISYGITLDLFSGFTFIDPYILDIFLHIYVFLIFYFKTGSHYEALTLLELASRWRWHQPYPVLLASAV